MANARRLNVCRMARNGAEWKTDTRFYGFRANQRRRIGVAKAGLEPARPYGQGILNPQRLPFRHSAKTHPHAKFTYFFAAVKPLCPHSTWKCNTI